MSATATEPRQSSPTAHQPTFWKRYSPRGECPLSVCGSVLLHVGIPVALVVFGLWVLTPDDTESKKPPRMDLVEIEGGGGGLGHIGTGTGKGEAGDASRTEGGLRDKRKGSAPKELMIPEAKIELKEKDHITFDPQDKSTDNPPEDNPFAFIEQQQRWAQAFLKSELIDPKAKADAGGSIGGPGGASGGTKGAGKGSKVGEGQGKGATGQVFSQQQRRALRWWLNLASEDGQEHLKKLQTLKVMVVIPLVSKKGYCMRFDLSKPKIEGQIMEFTRAHDPKRVHWVTATTDIEGRPDPALKAKGERSAAALGKVLGVPEVPRVVIIYLPADLEADMARRELQHTNRQEQEIKITIWDLRPIEGGYDNVPEIREQHLWPWVK